jgi:hypothetical protein
MWMGFLGYGDRSPPKPPSSSGPPPDGSDEGPDDTGIKLDPALAAARLRYRPKSSRLGRWAWAISLTLHCVVLIGAYIAYRYYIQQPKPAPTPAPVMSEGPARSGLLVAGADATDGVHFLYPGLWPSDKGPLAASEELDERDLPSMNSQSHVTFNSFSDDAFGGRHLPDTPPYDLQPWR